jgi:flagellar M-ring protein FliF
MGLLALAVLLMVVRPLVRRILAPAAGAFPALPPVAPGAALAEAPAAPGLTAEAAMALKAEQSETSKMIDIAQIQGQVHAQSVQKVGEIADRNPHETVSIIRQWLHESAAA